ETKSTNDGGKDKPAALVSDSATASKADSNPSPSKAFEDLKISSQLRKFTFNELRSAASNFQPDGLLGEGGFGRVYKGWIEKYGTAPVKPGTGLTVAVKMLSHDRIQGHKEWLDFNAKLSDFGLAKAGPEGDKTHVTTRVMGTFGYAAPEYVMTGHLTPRSDVYSFGVVLLEIMTGRRTMDKRRPAREQNLVEWARPYLGKKRQFYRIIDPRLHGNFSVKGAQKVAELVQACVGRNAKARPLMSEVVAVLKPLVDLNDIASSSASFRAMTKERAASIAASPTMESNTRQPKRSISRGSSPYLQPLRSLSPGSEP
ncbi:hypothetical protein B296_00012321, partial [Ensete ventricosum]